mmetsp:Transcript_14927/g.44235  ORF Transcript_14927/g.44235 Transcript_14927/m.44235 type:complete len:256 (+) Transcript_14927:85-852(+)
MPTVPQDKTSSASAFELSRLMAANAERSATRRATPVPSWCATCFSLTSSYVCEAGAPPSPAHTRTHTTLRCCLRRSALTNEAAGRQQPSCNGATFFAYHVGRASLVRSRRTGTRAESSRSSRCIQTLACALPREFTGMFIARCLVTIPGGGTPPPPLLPPQRTRRLHLSAKAAPSVASKGQASPGAGEEQGRGGARGSARRERAPRGSAAVSPHGLVLERWCHLRARAVAVAAVFVGCEARESELMQSGDIIDQR